MDAQKGAFTSCSSQVSAGQRALELGSGTGYVGLVAAALGTDVTATDLPPTLPLLEKPAGGMEHLDPQGGLSRRGTLRSKLCLLRQGV